MEQTLTEPYVIEKPLSRKQVGNYLLIRELGCGGYAHVYLAEHLYLKHLVALKLLNLSLSQHEDLVRFQFEARLLAQLRHRHIVRALDFGWEGDTPFLAMDYAGECITTTFVPSDRLACSFFQGIGTHPVMQTACLVTASNTFVGVAMVIARL